MEDKRVIKTKRNLKQTMIEMLKEMSFDKIHVTELCKRAYISRITFYTYYEDKYDLLDDCFNDISKNLVQSFRDLEESNKDKDPYDSAHNLLNALLDNYYDNFDFFASIKVTGERVLVTSYYKFLYGNVEKFVDTYLADVETNYLKSDIVTFMVTGFWGLIHMASSSHDESMQDEKTKANRLLDDILFSNIFPEGTFGTRRDK
jgi:AcrR family transcriptional regulator